MFTPAKFHCTFHPLERYGTVLKSTNIFARYGEHDKQLERNFACGYVFDRGPKENMIGRASLKTTGPG